MLFSMGVSFLAEQLSLPTLGAGARHQGRRKAPRKAPTSVLNLSLSLIPTIPSGGSFLRWEAVGKNVLLWPAVFEGGIVTAAVS